MTINMLETTQVNFNRNKSFVCFEESVRFNIETKASDFAIEATLNQFGHLLEFFYRLAKGLGDALYQ